MDPQDSLILMADGVALDLGGDFALFAPGNDPKGAALNWLRANQEEFYESYGTIYVSQGSAERFLNAWRR